MTAGLFSPALAKEVRALAPAWLAAMAIVVLARAGAGVDNAARDGVGNAALGYLCVLAGLLGCALGAVGLGALSVGHEYTNRTLPLLLSQPIDRRRLFLTKLVVLVTMVGALVAVTATLFQHVLAGVPSPHASSGVAVVAVVSALSIAPWLTMVCRSPLAGAVFAVAIPGFLGTVSDLIAGVVYGLDRLAAVDWLSARIFWSTMALAWAVAAAGSWRRFLRLEVTDGSSAELQVPGAAFGRSADRQRRPVSAPRALVAKELRLQQMTFIIAGIFTVVWGGAAWREPSLAGHPAFPFLPVTVFYSLMLALLAGSLTSAQERQLGTFEWQALQPVAAWQQWLVKAGVAWTLALTFGVALPAALASVFQPNAHLGVLHAPWLVAGMLALTSTGIYLSSMCGASITSLVCSVPAVVALVLYFRLITDNIVSPELHEPSEMLALAALLGLSALLVSLGFVNHRRHEHTTLRLLTQGPVIVGYITAALVVSLVSG